MNFPSQPQQGQYPTQNYQQSKFNVGYPNYTQSISPTQLIAPHPSHQIQPQPLTLTPAQLLQQQQGPAFMPGLVPQHIPPTPNQPQNSPMRIPFQPAMNPLRYAQLSPQERALFQRQQLAISPDRGPGTPTLHERAHERTPTQHDRAPSQQSHDMHDRPSSSASARSHHSHPAHDTVPMMPPPTSRPGTASGPPRMNQHPMNLNPNMNPLPINMGPHLAQGQNMNPPMPNINPQLNPAAMHMSGPQLGVPMNRPPTRTGSALGHPSPKQSPRMSMGHMGPSVGMGAGMGTMNAPGPINGNMGLGLGPHAISTMPAMGGMAAMGPMNMNASAPGPGGSIMPGAPGALMGPPVLPQGMQRPDRDPMMQPHMREPSAPVSREAVSMVVPLSDQAHGMLQSLPPTSAGPFMGLDNASVTAIAPNMPRQSSQPPPQQSPARQVPPPHRSPMPPMRKIGELPARAATPPVNVPPIPGTTPGQKLPPHIASLNPAVTKISYIPFVVPPKSSDAIDATPDEDKKPTSDESTTDTDKDGESKEPVKIEDPVPMLTSSEIMSLKSVMVRDSAYETVYRAKQARMLQELRTVGPGGRLAWWDRDFAANINRRPDRFDVRYPRPQRTDLAPRKKGARREGIRMLVSFLSFYSGNG